MNINLDKPFFRLVATALAGFLFLGAVMDSISNSFTLIPPLITYIFTPIILFGNIVFHYISREHPLTVKKSDDSIEVINGLNLKIIATTIGIIVLIWIPRFFDGTSQTLLPTQNINANLVSVPKITSTFVREYKFNTKEVQKSFSFRVTFVRSDIEPDFYRSAAVKKIEIIKANDLSLFQIIEFSDTEIIFFNLFKDNKSFVVEDLNFDGYPDFRFMISEGSGGDSFDCFLYYEGSGFVFDEDVSKIFSMKMVRFVPAKKQLHTYDKWCYKSIYQLDKDGLNFDLLKTEKECYDE